MTTGLASHHFMYASLHTYPSAARQLHGHSSPTHLSCSSPADYLVLASVDGGAGSSTAWIYLPLQLIAF